MRSGAMIAVIYDLQLNDEELCPRFQFSLEVNSDISQLNILGSLKQ